MRILNANHRLTLDLGDEGVDVEVASERLFSADIQQIYARWDEFEAWVKATGELPRTKIDRRALGAPSPRPPQVFAIGLNYGAHADEAGLARPSVPSVFTKFPASVTGPFDDIELPRGSVDFETELVVIIGRKARHVRARDAWKHVAGLTLGQDLSERELQLAGAPPQQFSMGKSFAGFAPMGPALVTIDEFANPDDVEIGCSLNGERMQHARTREMIFSVPQIIEFLSGVLPLLPGDVIFTGTPSGIGWARKPKRLIHPSDELVTYGKGIGEMKHRFFARIE